MIYHLHKNKWNLFAEVLAEVNKFYKISLLLHSSSPKQTKELVKSILGTKSRNSTIFSFFSAFENCGGNECGGRVHNAFHN